MQNRELRCVLALLIFVSVLPADSTKPEVLIAIEDVCAWPNLQLLPNGDIVALVFNQSCHGHWEADIDCWASTDGGKKWVKRGTAAPHEPGTNRMNIAAGLTGNGDLLVIASGFPGRPKPGKPGERSSPSLPHPLPLSNWVCRSKDGGRTWSHESFGDIPKSIVTLIPYGDILRGKDGTLTAAFYGSTIRDERTARGHLGRCDQFFLATSRDDGRTWGDIREIIASDAASNVVPRVYEPALIALNDHHWLAAIRGLRGSGTEAVRMFASTDAGKTWIDRGRLSLERQFPSHLLRLRDNRILLTYGSRRPELWGVVYRISKDEGATWSEPTTLVDFQQNGGDGGYPYSVQLADGTVVTAFYVGRPIPDRGTKYHMGVARWKP